MKIKKERGDNVSILTIIIMNKMTMYFLIHASINVAIYALLGWESLKYQIIYTLSGQFLFLVINYIEHYGLVRRKD